MGTHILISSEGGFSLMEWVEEEYLGVVKEAFSLVQWEDSH